MEQVAGQAMTQGTLRLLDYGILGLNVLFFIVVIGFLVKHVLAQNKLITELQEKRVQDAQGIALKAVEVIKEIDGTLRAFQE